MARATGKERPTQTVNCVDWAWILAQRRVDAKCWVESTLATCEPELSPHRLGSRQGWGDTSTFAFVTLCALDFVVLVLPVFVPGT